ncbi:MAG TPA: hypothetical protein VIC87_02470, partial [Vicinamibacteria bacterium]
MAWVNKVLAVGVVALCACGGTDIIGGSCSNSAGAGEGLSAIATGCTLASDSNVSIEVQPACQRCGQSAPSCDSELVGGVIELNPVFCGDDPGCPAQTCGTRFRCNVRTPAVSGPVEVQFPRGL